MDNMFEGNTVSMTLEDGTNLECEVIATFLVEDKSYMALLPDKIIEGYEEGDVFLYRYTLQGEEDIELFPIDNEDEYEMVADRFEELLDEYEFNNFDEE